MKSTNLLACLLLLVVAGTARTWCQSRGESSDEAQRLASGGASIASTVKLIGLEDEIDQLRRAQRDAPAGSPEQWKILWLHQRIFERVTMIQLQVDATVAEIDNEAARSAEVHGYLSDKRDNKVSRANLLGALIGGGLGGTSAGLQLSSRSTNAAVATGVAGGAIAAGLAVYGIHAQRGGTRTLETESNMLAEFFDRPELQTSHYPAVIWQFLDQVAPSDPDHLTRRERLMRTWLELKRLDPPPNTVAGQIKIDHVTSMPAEHQLLTIDDLEDRIAMLQDVRAKLSYLKRDLAAVLGTLPDSGIAHAPGGLDQ